MPASVAAAAAAATSGPARKKAPAAPKVQLSADAQKAMELVEAAAEALPALDVEQLSFQEGGWGAGVNPELTEPPELGSKVSREEVCRTRNMRSGAAGKVHGALCTDTAISVQLARCCTCHNVHAPHLLRLLLRPSAASRSSHTHHMATLQDIPRGHPDAFTGKTFVFSGVLPALWRDAAKELIASHGGRVTGDVSGKTSFLVLGAAGSRRKYDKVHGRGGALTLSGAMGSIQSSACGQHCTRHATLLRVMHLPASYCF